MTLPQHEASGNLLHIEGRTSWWDPGSESTIVVARPADEPGLWNEYVEGALGNYRRHGVQRALDMDGLRSGGDTAVFCAGVDERGDVVGGVRVKGPYRSPDECHAVVEWAGQPGLDAVRKMVADRLPFGVVEVKTAWVADGREQSRELTNVLARMPLHSMTLLDIQFAVATAASYVLNRWLASGGVLASRIPATPYPDERYQTKMMWWDRRTFTSHAEPGQLSAYFREAQAIAARRDATETPALELSR